MGIKNIHIGLIAVSSLLSLVFGVWGIKHQFQFLGVASMGACIGLIFYGISFWKKAKTI